MLPDVAARDWDGCLSGAGVEGVYFGFGAGIGDGSQDPLDDGHKTEHGAKALVV